MVLKVVATFTGYIDAARWKRINAAIERAGVGPMRFYHKIGRLGLRHFFRLPVGDRDRALRLASGLRACGMVVKVVEDTGGNSG